jgi:hypothetical protein
MNWDGLRQTVHRFFGQVDAFGESLRDADFTVLVRGDG